jgi:hypothetical protein
MTKAGHESFVGYFGGTCGDTLSLHKILLVAVLTPLLGRVRSSGSKEGCLIPPRIGLMVVV